MEVIVSIAPETDFMITLLLEVSIFLMLNFFPNDNAAEGKVTVTALKVASTRSSRQ
jgi:hypothetical protein